jgi:uncharacterized protein (TIGR02145 family)
VKRKYTSLLSVLLLLTTFALVSCSKKNSDNTPVEDKNSVKINGVTYPTVTIGSQIWTSVNYKGPGGYSAAETDIYGSYYTRSQANAITLPVGWRVPSISDYNKLISNFTSIKDSQGNYLLIDGSAEALCASSGWQSRQGTNTSGFNALPSGGYLVRSGQVIYESVQHSFYVTSDFRPITAYEPALYSVEIDLSTGSINQTQDPEFLSISLRFVKDK